MTGSLPFLFHFDKGGKTPRRVFYNNIGGDAKKKKGDINMIIGTALHGTWIWESRACELWSART
jgi:hypothetical protein